MPCTSRENCSTSGRKRRPRRAVPRGGFATTPTSPRTTEDETIVQVKRQLSDALTRADDSPALRPETLLEGVYADPDELEHAAPQVTRAREDLSSGDQRRGSGRRCSTTGGCSLIGEDVGVYGGAFKVTQDFLEEFGAWRVIDTPLSETAILGGATGAAMMGPPSCRGDAVRRLRLLRMGPSGDGGCEATLASGVRQFRSRCGSRRAAGSRRSVPLAQPRVVRSRTSRA